MTDYEITLEAPKSTVLGRERVFSEATTNVLGKLVMLLSKFDEPGVNVEFEDAKVPDYFHETPTIVDAINTVSQYNLSREAVVAALNFNFSRTHQELVERIVN